MFLEVSNCLVAEVQIYWYRCRNPDVRPTAFELQSHPYLIIPPDWKFNGFKSRTRRAVDPERVLPRLEMVTLRLPPQLDRFRVFSSKAESARQWLDANQEDILDYISNQDLAPEDKTVCTGWVKSGIIYEVSYFSTNSIMPMYWQDPAAYYLHFWTFNYL